MLTSCLEEVTHSCGWRSQILRKCRKVGYVVPNITTRGQGDGVSYEGATVLEAKAGFYEQPVATLDFASLYPSIMMAHNLCYSTLVPRQQASQFSPDEITRTPSGDHFIKAKGELQVWGVIKRLTWMASTVPPPGRASVPVLHLLATQRMAIRLMAIQLMATQLTAAFGNPCRAVKPGILPEILQELLAARKKARKEMGAETDEFKKAVLNGRQLALKISANSGEERACFALDLCQLG